MKRLTLRTIRQWAAEGRKFGMLTCYDATSARWLARGGCQAMLVGDTAAQMVLGHSSTLPATMELQLMLTAAVRRGAPEAFVMADMPFGSYQACDAEGMRNAMRFLSEADADCVKLEVGARQAGLVRKLGAAGVPVVAHIGCKPQHIRSEGGIRATGRDAASLAQVVEEARLMVEAGAAMLLIEAVPDAAAEAAVAVAHAANPLVPVVGCGAGPRCDSHVVVLNDLLGLTDWQPAFAPPAAKLGASMQDAVSHWLQEVAAGRYLSGGSPYNPSGAG